MTKQEARARIKNKNILLSFCIVLKNRNDRFTLKFFFFLTVLAFALLFMIPFQYQSVNGSLTSPINQSDVSNTTASLTSSADNDQTKPNSTMGIAKSLQNTTKQNSTLSPSIPGHNTSNLVITSPDQEEQQLQSLPSPITQQQNVEGTQLPLLPFEQEIQQPQIFSPPTYQQEPSVIQLQQLSQSVPFSASVYPQAPSLIQSQLSQSFPSLTTTYPQAPSLIQLQQLLQQQSVPFSVNTLTTLPVLLPETIQPIQIPPRILSYSSYVSSTGNMHIVGEVINESYQLVRFVEITATFYDANNRVIGTDFTFTNPSTLQPGQRAPFDMIIIEGSIPTYLMAYYTLSVDYSDF